mmetsp:Transcript_10035/g.27350  ORF Transcript_10035/g.27350 Transcript_10035/m.27350 type:complete len:274 (-) Transcript_10035:2331-3152(-)
MLILLGIKLEAPCLLHQALHQTTQACGAVVVHCRDVLLPAGSQPCQPRVHMCIKEAVDVLPMAWCKHGQPLRQALIAPSLDGRSPTKLLLGQVHHATTTDSGRRSRCQILNLKQHAHGPRVELNALSIGQAQGTIVVQHCIHVFDPHRVDGAVKHHPLLVRAGVGHSRADKRGAQPIHPLPCEVVVLAVQFTHSDALGIEGVSVRDLVRINFALQVGPQMCQRALQRAVAFRLAYSRGPHQDHTKAHIHCVIQLDDLCHVALRTLQAPLLQHV